MSEITIEKVDEFYRFLQGENPAEISCKPLNLSQKKASKIIWYLQEQLEVLPDRFIRCTVCGELFDVDNGGGFRKGKPVCDCQYGKF